MTDQPNGTHMPPSEALQALMDDGLSITTDHIFQEQIQLCQPKEGYRFGTDAVLLAASIATKKGRCLDMGSGVGAVAIGAAWRCPDLHVTAIEKEPVLATLLRHNIAVNHLTERMRVWQGDITVMPPMLANSFDHVVANPPFHQPGGTRPSNRRKALAHAGDGPSLTDWVRAGLWACKPKGQISFIIRADRGDEVITALRTGGAGEIVQYPVWSYHSSPAVRLLISARKAVQGVSALLPGIVLHHTNGALTEAANSVMRGEALMMAHPAMPATRQRNGQRNGQKNRQTEPTKPE